MLIMDRPYPVDHEYKGIKIKIDFRYPDGGSLPTLATITAEDAPGICDIVDIAEETYEAAIEAGKRAAEAWIDLK